MKLVFVLIVTVHSAVFCGSSLGLSCPGNLAAAYLNVKSHGYFWKDTSYNRPIDAIQFHSHYLRELVEPLAGSNCATRELLELSLKTEISTPQFRSQLTRLLHRNGMAGWKVLTPSEVLSQVDRYIREGRLPPAREGSAGASSYVQGGYVVPYVWDLMISEKIFPVLDEHDFFLHLPSFFIPEFRAAVENVAAFNLRWLGRLNTASIPDSKQRFSTPLLKAASSALRFLSSTVRLMSQENLSFIVNGEFALQGAWAHRIFYPYYEILGEKSPLYYPETMISLLMGSDIVGSRANNFYFERLPQIQEFLESDGVAGREFYELLLELGIVQPSRGAIRKKLNAALASAYEGNLGARLREAFIEMGINSVEGYQARRRLRGTVLKELTPGRRPTRRESFQRIARSLVEAAEKDPVIEGFFNTSNRIRLLAEAPLFLERYLEWTARK